MWEVVVEKMGWTAQPPSLISFTQAMKRAPDWYLARWIELCNVQCATEPSQLHRVHSIRATIPPRLEVHSTVLGGVIARQRLRKEGRDAGPGAGSQELEPGPRDPCDPTDLPAALVLRKQ